MPVQSETGRQHSTAEVGGGRPCVSCWRPRSAKRLKELDKENQRLKRIVADKELEIDALQEIAEGKWACKIVGQHRSTHRHRPEHQDPDKNLRADLRTFARRHPRLGYRRARTLPCRRGHRLNRKKVQRIWREEGLRVPPRCHKRKSLGVSSTPADRLSAKEADHVWALDYLFDVTSFGRTIKILHVIDEFTGESLCDLVAYSIDADATVAALDAVEGTVPQFVRMDNGPELTAHALRDWCRFTGTATSYIEQFDSLLEAEVLVTDWREEYNTYRPHSALGMLTPSEFADRTYPPKGYLHRPRLRSHSSRRSLALRR